MNKDKDMDMDWDITHKPESREEFEALLDYDVYSYDAERIGTVADVFRSEGEMPEAYGGYYLRVEPGTVRKFLANLDEIYVPEHLIHSFDREQERVVLRLPREELELQDWGPPDDLDAMTGTARR
jgi:hypothetical protein